MSCILVLGSYVLVLDFLTSKFNNMKLYYSLFLFLVFSASVFAGPVTKHGKLKVDGIQMVDENNQPVVLRGVSFGWHNWWPRFYNADAVTWLTTDWNCSVVRAAMGVDPDKGYRANPEWSEQLVCEVVDAAIKNDIYVIIDWHSHNIRLEEAKIFFTKMAEKYGHHPHVIYEIFNEPERQQWPEIKAYSEEVIKTIRAIDPDNIILVGSPHWDQDVDVAAADPIKGHTNLMYSLHFYAATHKKYLRDKAETALEKGLALFVSECAGMEATGNGPINHEEWQQWLNWMESRKISWVSWSISDKNETCSMLLPSAASTGNWKNDDIKEWGQITRKCIKKHNIEGFTLNSQEYFERGGANVMAYQDIYPDGHQGGVAVIQHGTRLATNGDIRLNHTPGQWQPLPKQQKRVVDAKENAIRVTMTYPDSSRHLKGFNPIVYPDLALKYDVNVKAEGESIIITVDLDKPIPPEFIGQVGFNMELYPDLFFGKTWILDNQSGIFPPQPNGPVAAEKLKVTVPDDKTLWVEDEVLPRPLASGQRLVVAPETELTCLSIESKGAPLMLLDGRINHNNGWFVVRTEVAANTTKKAIEWVLTPKVKQGWIQEPTIQISQVGYHPKQAKKIFIELDKNDFYRTEVELLKVNSDDTKSVFKRKGDSWGQFLRYDYLTVDFSDVEEEGVYQVKYGNAVSHPFRIAANVFATDVWQPTLEYFLPVQMCHMRVNEKYRVWHGLCHMDDALMAPVDHNHFDGYVQGASTLTQYKPGEHVPGLNIGGWHDAGDYDLRVESQSYEVYILGLCFEEFNPRYDATSVDQLTRIVEIHQPDGKDDLLQQIEHGTLSITSAYKNLGRLYRGIIAPTLRQYVLLGDGANMTDNLAWDPKLNAGERTGNTSSLKDDRWVFTENNPARELTSASHLALAARVLKGFNDTLSLQSLYIAEAIFNTHKSKVYPQSVALASELFLTTGKEEYKQFLLTNEKTVLDNLRNNGWIVGKALAKMNNKAFSDKVRAGIKTVAENINQQKKETPYGIPYRPHIWGAGWDIQSFGVRQYFLHKSFPDILDDDCVYSALNFVLGCHPGVNTASFASGVGSQSMTIAYGTNRADRSYIPGGVVSGTALIQPDFPELLNFPFLWQQTEYVMGGGATNFMFLVLAVNELLK